LHLEGKSPGVGGGVKNDHGRVGPTKNESKQGPGQAIESTSLPKVGGARHGPPEYLEKGQKGWDIRKRMHDFWGGKEQGLMADNLYYY